MKVEELINRIIAAQSLTDLSQVVEDLNNELECEEKDLNKAVSLRLTKEIFKAKERINKKTPNSKPYLRNWIENFNDSPELSGSLRQIASHADLDDGERYYLKESALQIDGLYELALTLYEQLSESA